MAGMGWWVALLSTLLALGCAAAAWRLRARLHDTEQRMQELAQRFHERKAELTQISVRDALTGVASRRVFDETLQSEWTRAARGRHVLAIMIVDIDRFKLHNDTYGHQAGDECLRQVAAVLRDCLRRPADVIARYGGEEFGVILPGVHADGAMAVAERMRQRVEAIQLPHARSAVGHDVTVSVGVAVTLPQPRVSAATLVTAADEALYTAKAVGRNQVILADTARQTEAAL